MGGGNFVLMKDVSSPIHVRGRHWGTFRMGFRQSCAQNKNPQNNPMQSRPAPGLGA
jgi:hypothetical protein